MGQVVDQVNCYPPDSPQNPNGSRADPLAPNCHQPQIWMAAIDLTATEIGGDPSFPAFWLPFQEVTAHNHIAQWVVSIVGENPDGGACVPLGNMCVPATNCCGGFCVNGICTIP